MNPELVSPSSWPPHIHVGLLLVPSLVLCSPTRATGTLVWLELTAGEGRILVGGTGTLIGPWATKGVKRVVHSHLHPPPMSGGQSRQGKPGLGAESERPRRVCAWGDGFTSELKTERPGCGLTAQAVCTEVGGGGGMG